MSLIGKYIIDNYHTCGEPRIIYKIIDESFCVPHGFVSGIEHCIRIKEIDSNFIDVKCQSWWIRVSLIGDFNSLYSFIDYTPKGCQLSLFDFIGD